MSSPFPILSNWSWGDFCGRDSFIVWNTKHRDLDICFQYVAFQMPVLMLLAISSAYYIGALRLHLNRCTRDRIVLRLRSFFTLLLATLPIVRSYLEESKYPGQVHSVEFTVAAIQTSTWLVHWVYLAQLQRKLSSSLRGPIFMGTMWSINYVVCLMNLHTNLLIAQRPDTVLYESELPLNFAIAETALQNLYLLTLIPTGRSPPSVRFQPLSSPSLEDGPSMYSFETRSQPGSLGLPMEGMSLGRLCFSWVNALLNKGSRGQLENDSDLFDLPDCLTARHLSSKINSAVYPMHTGYIRKSIFRALHSCFWVEFYCIGILKLFGDIASFSVPLLLKQLIQFVENRSEPILNGYAYAAGLCLASLLGAFFNCHFNFKMSLVSLRIRGALVSLIYRKTLSLNKVTLSSLETGEIVNYMSTDVNRIMNSCISFHSFWSIPLEVCVICWLLYREVGMAFLAVIVLTIVLIPVNKITASLIMRFSTAMMTHKDKRISSMREILKGIKTIKLNVWESAFLQSVGVHRKLEMKYLSYRKYLDAICVYLWATTPVMVTTSTIYLYLYFGHQLTATLVFTTMALLNMLIVPLNSFPWVLNGLVDAWVSIKRVEKLIKLSDEDLHKYYSVAEPSQFEDSVIEIRDATFSWGEGNFHLRGINVSIKEGQLVGIIGPVGSGKSSLLAAIMAELGKTSGSVAMPCYNAGFGYVAQVPWLQRGTLYENVTFGDPCCQNTKYLSILEACALKEDIQSLPGGDNYNVGDGGSGLSGGQKARVSLARAVYKDMPVYLLDDILSSVDANVASHIFERCICGLLKGKTRILVTHQPQFLMNADHVIELNDGEIVRQGEPSEVLRDYKYREYVGEPARASTATTQTDGRESDDIQLSEQIDDEDERRIYGSLEWKVYRSYFSSAGVCVWPLIIAFIVLMQASGNLNDWWLARWVSNLPEEEHKPYPFIPVPVDNSTGQSYYLSVYVAIGGVTSTLAFFRAFLFAYGGLLAAKTIHNELLSTVINARIIFFDTVSMGHVLNRFSSDTSTIDDSLPFMMNILFSIFFRVLGVLVTIMYSMPWLCLIVAPLVPIYHNLQRTYRLTSRELKRLSTLTLSPLYSHFTETIDGLVTIRAFRDASKFRAYNEFRLDSSTKTQLSSAAVAQWLSLRLQLIGVALTSGVGLLAIMRHHVDVADPGFVGLAITYTLMLNSVLGSLVSVVTETEMEMVSVERVKRYLDKGAPGLEGETRISSSTKTVPFGWPASGIVNFKDVYFKHRDDLPECLKNVKFEIRCREKFGIVGRTGAGKSSIVAALFRLADVSEGLITIDGVDIRHVALDELRYKMGIIPQDPFIFTGSIRANLDPKKLFMDEDLWNVLDEIQLAEAVTTMGGLDKEIKPDSLSVGQNQLICLARAVLHNAKVVCIDEATANLDENTDQLMQRTIQNRFRNSTVIMIAHRIQTVMNCNRVLVLDKGRVVECGEPNELLQNSNSYFSCLYAAA